ncbi:MAG TPA: tetraacyldisaccharide 4'-kinase [Casimicrobiaceae bacterium]|nr:tetraacyldisaccharide 4'-kinase [Casimicrobiaceae bacterium]
MSRAGAALARTWYSRRSTPVAALLNPLAWIFGAAAALRRAGYRNNLLKRTRVGVPVIVVGNITIGGSGKTPLVAALVRALAARGRHPGIVSRGHGRRTRDTRGVRAGDHPDEVGDEPLLLAATGAPVVVGRDRVAAARLLLATHPDVDVVVADDGLQHYALARDVEIAVVDAARGLGNERLLPAGPLREPASRLDSVDALVWRTAAGVRPRMRAHAHEFVVDYEPASWINLVDPARGFDCTWLADRANVAIAGIGNPDAFFDGLRAQGFAGSTHAFPDHHRYTRDDVAFPGASAVLMTEKDAVKCRAFGDARMWMLPIDARIDPALVDLVLEKIDGPEAARNAGLSGDEGSADL